VVNIDAAEMLEACVECDCLLQEYTDSINTHLEAVRRSHSAAESLNRAALTESERLENLALQQRHKVRRTLMEHEVNHLIHDLTMRQQVCD
jgi:hypothetical protein